MANKKIIELDAASQVNSDALFPLSQLVDSNQKTLKATVAQMQAAMLAPVSGLVTLGESSGSIASFSTDIADKLFSCYVNVVATQAGSGTPSPDNVRAISGWSACNLTGCGKNLVLGTNQSFIASSNTTKTLVSDMWLSEGTYTLSFNVSTSITSTRNRPLYYDLINGQNVYSSVDYNTSGRQSWTFTLTEKKKVSFRWWIVDNNNAVNITDFQLEKAESSTTYSAYNGTTHNIPFNTTVYGGVLDVLSGVLTVTHGMVDLGTLNWSYNLGIFFTNDLQNYIDLEVNEQDVISDIYRTTTLPTWAGNVAWQNEQDYTIGKKDNYIYCINRDYSSYSDFTTAMNGVILVYELATPTTIQLTPTEIKTILGQNNIFGDCGDIDLKYLETIGNRL